MFKKKASCLLLVCVLVISNFSFIVQAADGETKLEISVTRVKELTRKAINELNEMTISDRIGISGALKEYLRSDTNLDMLADGIEDEDADLGYLEDPIQRLENAGFQRKMMADVVRLVKVFDEEKRVEYISSWNNGETIDPIEEELAAYGRSVETLPALDKIMEDHDVEVGNFIFLLGLCRNLSNDKAILTDDTTNLNYFAYIDTAISEDKKVQVDAVLADYTVNGVDYSNFDDVAHDYLTKFNEKYLEITNRLAESKVILARHGLYTPTLEKAEEMVVMVENSQTRNNARKAQIIVDALDGVEYETEKEELNNRIAALGIQTLPGDVNGDNMVNVLDAIMLLNYTVDKIKFSTVQFEVADLNDDDSLDVLDIIKLLNMIVES